MSLAEEHEMRGESSVDSLGHFSVSTVMAVRIEFHPPPRRRGVRRERPSALLFIGIATVIVGTHLLLWMVGLIG